MFRVRFNSPDSWLVGVNRFQHEDENKNEYEVLAIGFLFISLEILWSNKNKVLV